MDFIFEEDMEDVGSDIEAYCPKCKGDTAHTVITKYEDEIRRVQCSTCGDVHAYRKPRGEVEDEIPEPVAAKKRATAKKPTWQEAIDKAGNKAVNNARPYSIRERYHEGDIVSHPKFGVGFVTEISENKAEVTFQDERRVLVHNRPDLAAQMPAIAQIVAPRPRPGGRTEDKKGKKPQQPKVAAAAAAAAGAGKAGKPKVEVKKPEPAPETKKAAVAMQGKAERAKAAAAKKGAAKGKPVAAAKPMAKPAKKSAGGKSVHLTSRSAGKVKAKPAKLKKAKAR
jgi:Zn ribbon nucleic-acid-binding protein